MKQAMDIKRIFLLLMLYFASNWVYAATLPGIPEFIDEMVTKHKFKRAELESVFAHAQHVQSVLDAISRPFTVKPWLEYRGAFVNPERIKLGVKFWNKHHRSLQYAERKYGVPQEIIVAVIGVETIYGKDAGTYRTIDALSTLAFDYPQRAEFFRAELEDFLLLAREQNFNLLAIRGSYAGALGIPQFMPSSYRTYAVDFNGNHKINLMHEANDAIGSVANYLKGYGWVSDMTKASETGVTDVLLPQKKHIGQRPPIAVRVQVSEEICAGNITAPRTVAEWSAAGIQPGESIAGDLPARLIDFTVGEGKEFWLAFGNFDVITRYNNSDYYAMSVFQLAEELKQARKSSRTRKATPAM
jgi:membrane-bound lytic murein transglycosylase B